MKMIADRCWQNTLREKKKEHLLSLHLLKFALAYANL